MNKQIVHQSKFFEHLFRRKGKALVLTEMMEILSIQKGAAYKRISGETALTVSEMFQLASHFNISLDTAFENAPFTSFSHPFLDSAKNIGLLEIYEYYLKPIIHAKESSLTYLANEIPIFYYLSHPHIFNFLNVLWEHMHKSDNKLHITKTNIESEKLENLRSSITAYYNYRPVTEIWNANMLANLYQQIIFSISIRAFENTSVLDDLIQDIQILIDDLKNTSQKKEEIIDENKTKIYLNEFGNYLNMVIYQTDKLKATFVGMDIPQFMVSHDPTIYSFANNWVEQIKKRSVLISSGGYQNRELFFVKLEKDFQQFRDNTLKLTGLYY